MILPLLQAQHHANALCDWLRPYCDPNTGSVITVAGSIRRQRPHVNDIDLVCIPTLTETKDLMGEVISRHYPILDFLSDYIRKANPIHSQTDSLPHFISGWDLDRADKSTQKLSAPSQVIIWLPKIRCQLDLWLADQTTYATRLLMRTGSKEHNIWLCERAASLGGHWNPYEGVTINRVKIPTPNEESLYAALQLKYIEPIHRERDWLHHHLEYGL
jgi:DNA polymerase/3'-5' exonuclease PolX